MKKIALALLLLVGSLSFAQIKKYQVKNLKINTKYPHFGISLQGKSRIIFTSYVFTKKGKVKKTFDGEGALVIYEGIVTNDGNIENIKPIVIDPKANIKSITSAALSPDGKQLYITTTYTDNNMPKGSFNKANFHIEVGTYEAGIGFTNFKVLPFCKPRYSYAHPTLSADGKTLLFTANIRGGRETTKGASDIFKVSILEDRTFGKVKNLGSKVNSYSREMFPTMGANNILYFSSNKPNGIGGYDLYKSTMNEDGTFSKAKILPKPLNSKEDDLSMVMLPNRNSGFIVSKRKGGEGDDDIYHFVIQ
ncbi:TolB-like translocation protein [Hyunsoonleella pacifica]|uniref:WD40 repeat protein n=1 Tax=Hyunsoonleella pacifica TaxID=1080224 RepID=A0A4Q9FNS4_9FLAO|nr:PD40 domain-containing protein [Hyunsoonleella pacifica]TBN15413.1 hypothetical protein EYD46_09745 [Hyunsoonleella pacifica]GGD23864.1 hypothetical protein GCM10011368_27400 [Hyunsoonleella pacifica]